MVSCVAVCDMSLFVFREYFLFFAFLVDRSCFSVNRFDLFSRYSLIFVVFGFVELVFEVE